MLLDFIFHYLYSTVDLKRSDRRISHQPPTSTSLIFISNELVKGRKMDNHYPHSKERSTHETDESVSISASFRRLLVRRPSSPLSSPNHSSSSVVCLHHIVYQSYRHIYRPKEQSWLVKLVMLEVRPERWMESSSSAHHHHSPFCDLFPLLQP